MSPQHLRKSVTHHTSDSSTTRTWHICHQLAIFGCTYRSRVAACASEIMLTERGLPPLVRCCIGCIVTMACIGNPENDALLCIPADLSPVVLLSIAVLKLDGIALHLKTGSGQQIRGDSETKSVKGYGTVEVRGGNYQNLVPATSRVQRVDVSDCWPHQSQVESPAPEVQANCLLACTVHNSGDLKTA